MFGNHTHKSYWIINKNHECISFHTPIKKKKKPFQTHVEEGKGHWLRASAYQLVAIKSAILRQTGREKRGLSVAVQAFPSQHMFVTELGTTNFALSRRFQQHLTSVYIWQGTFSSSIHSIWLCPLYNHHCSAFILFTNTYVLSPARLEWNVNF